MSVRMKNECCITTAAGKIEMLCEMRNRQEVSGVELRNEELRRRRTPLSPLIEPDGGGIEATNATFLVRNNLNEKFQEGQLQSCSDTLLPDG